MALREEPTSFEDWKETELPAMIRIYSDNQGGTSEALNAIYDLLDKIASDIVKFPAERVLVSILEGIQTATGERPTDITPGVLPPIYVSMLVHISTSKCRPIDESALRKEYVERLKMLTDLNKPGSILYFMMTSVYTDFIDSYGDQVCIEIFFDALCEINGHYPPLELDAHLVNSFISLMQTNTRPGRFQSLPKDPMAAMKAKFAGLLESFGMK